MGQLATPSTKLLSAAHASAVEVLAGASRSLAGSTDTSNLSARLKDAQRLLTNTPEQVILAVTPYILRTDPDGKIYVLLSERTHGALKGLLIPPGGGKVDANESIWTALQREYAEEMGRRSSDGQVLDGTTRLARNRILDHQGLYVFNVEVSELVNGARPQEQDKEFMIDLQVPFLNRQFPEAYVFTENPEKPKMGPPVWVPLELLLSGFARCKEPGNYSVIDDSGASELVLWPTQAAQQFAARFQPKVTDHKVTWNAQKRRELLKLFPKYPERFLALEDHLQRLARQSNPVEKLSLPSAD